MDVVAIHLMQPDVEQAKLTPYLSLLWIIFREAVCLLLQMVEGG
jgi:hypothetical protein